MKIPLCVKCHKHPRYTSLSDLCIDCLSPEEADIISAQISTERQLSDAVEISNLQYGTPADEEDV